MFVVPILFLLTAFSQAKDSNNSRAPIKPEETFSWSSLTFQWPSEEVKNQAIASRDYIPENPFPLGIERWRNKMFVSTPRWKKGIPSTINYFDLDTANATSPLLIPYPSWEANALPKTDGLTLEVGPIISILRPRVDACNRLWILDTGINNLWGGESRIGLLSLHIFDLLTDTLIRKYTFKSSDSESKSFFVNIEVDVADIDCDSAFAYAVDLRANGLVVYDFAKNDSWRVSHHYFNFDPIKGDFTVGGLNFQWAGGILGHAQGPRFANGSRRLYFHALSSDNQFSVSTEVLKNKTLATDSKLSFHLYRLEGNKGWNTQATSAAYDEKTNVLFFALLNYDGVACWKTTKELKPENVAIVTQDHQKLIYINDIRVDFERNFWIISDQLPAYERNLLNYAEVNYRIFKIPVDQLINGTVCQ